MVDDRQKLLTLLMIALAFIALATSVATFGEPQRAYVIDKEVPESTVRIDDQGQVAKKAKTEVVLRDPTLQIKIDPNAKPVRVKTEIIKKFERHPAKLNFGRMAVMGRNFKPRVEFDREDLDLKIVDEPQNDDFLQNAFKPVERDFLYE